MVEHEARKYFLFPAHTSCFLHILPVSGRTVLVIAHRLSTIRDADVIAVVSHGKIVEVGSQIS